MEMWQFWLLTLSSLLLALTVIGLGVYLALTVRNLRKILGSIERNVGDLSPIFDFFFGVEQTRKQAQQSKKQTLNSSWSYEAGQLAADWALNSLALWKLLSKRRKS